MDLLLAITVALFGAAALAVVAHLAVGGIVVRAREKTRERRTKQYSGILYQALDPSADPAAIRFPEIRSRRARLLLAELTAGLSRSLYGYENDRLAQIVRQEGLDLLLASEAARRRGYKRAEALKLLSHLPVRYEAIVRIQRFLGDKHNFVRLAVLVATISHSPQQSLTIIRHYGRPMEMLGLIDLALILRRKFAPARHYVTLLESGDRNAVRLGLAVVRLFDIEPATARVTALVGSHDLLIRREALDTLIALHAPLGKTEVVGVVARMNETGRRVFYRRAIAEDYSPRTLAKYAALERDKPLSDYIVALGESYSRKLSRQTKTAAL